MTDNFLLGSKDENSFKYNGIQINQLKKHICYPQYDYDIGLKPLKPDYVSDKMTQLSSQVRSEYRRICGQLNLLASQLRPDISFDICQLSTWESQLL